METPGIETPSNEGRSAVFAPPSRRFLKLWVLGGAGILGLWLALGYAVVPALVRSAYAGESLPLLNDLISGRDTHDVGRYLDLARGLANRATIGLVATLVLLPVLWSARFVIGAGLRPLTRGGATGSRGALILAAMWLGLVLGFAEAALGWFRYRAGGILTEGSDPNVFWRAPIAQGILFALIATALAMWLGRRGRPVSYRVIVGLCAALGFFSLVQGLNLGAPPLSLGIHPVAVLILAVGLAARTAHWVEARPRARALFRTTAIPLAAAFALTPVLLTGAGRLMESRRLAATAADGDPPNVLLLVLDTVRKESLGLYGYDRPNTPNLERIAEGAAVFERAIATAPWTLPTHASLFTGRLPYELTADRQAPLDDAYPTLAEFLTERGYATAGFTANLLYTSRLTGLGRGFLRYEDHPDGPASIAFGSWLSREIARWIWRRLPTERAELQRKYAPVIADAFLDWQDGLGDRPFFAFLNMYDAHAPYEIHEEFLADVPPERPIREVRLADGTREPVSRELGVAIDGYDSGIALMDHTIGAMLRELEARRALERTVLIITSDHGEHLGDHGLVDHLNSLYAQLVLVPLIIRVPGETVGASRIETAVSLRDVPATIVDLAGLDRSPFPGRSLRPLWTGEPGPRPSRPVLSELSAAAEWAEGSPDEPVARGPMKSLVEGSLHYILNGDGTEELYDLSNDEGEHRDLISAPWADSIVPPLRERLRAIAALDTIARSATYRRAGR